MQIRHQERALTIVGIELRTTNQDAQQTIPPHWQRFTQEAVLGQLHDRSSDDVYAVYTHFEHAGLDNHGLYSLVIGAAVPAAAPVPAGMVRVVMPASHHAVFPVERGRFDRVGAAWQAIWQAPLVRTCIADCEHYRPTGEIEILVGVHPRQQPTA